LNIGPGLLSSKLLLTLRDVWGAGYAKRTVLPEQLSSIEWHGFMPNAASVVDVALRYALKEQSHCVPNDFTVKERLGRTF
jgi:hypothetical protein